MPEAIPGVELLDVALIDPSPTNPRKAFDPDEVTELAEDLKLRGFLQFPIVRVAGDRYELVIGEKRWRAAKQAELERIPCTVRDMTDQEVLEAQIVENAKRSGASPLEEADAYQALIGRHGYTPEAVADKVGKSRSWVYQRLQLRHLGAVARKLLAEGKLTAGLAGLLARIPQGAKLQDKAARDLCRDWTYRQEPMSVRQAREHIEREFMLRLDEAPWKLDDELLLVEAGPCTTCPKRTGNQRDLFADVVSPDVCTDPPCFDEKRKANAKRRVVDLKRAGATPLKAAEAKKHIAKDWNGAPRVQTAAPFVALDERCHDDPKGRTYRKLLKPSDADLTFAKVGAQVVEMLPRAGLAAKLKAAGVAKPKPQRTTTRAAASENSFAKNRRLEDEIERRARGEIRDQAPSVWDGSDTPRPVLQHLARTLLSLAYLDTRLAEEMLAVRELEPVKRSRPEDVLSDWVEVAMSRDLAALIAELCLHGDPLGGKTSPLESTCSVFGVDHAAIAKAVRADAKKLEPKKAPKKKAAKRKPRAKAPAEGLAS